MSNIMENIYDQYNKILENGFELKYVVMNECDYKMYILYTHNIKNTILELPIILIKQPIKTVVVTDAILEYGYDVRS